jgi:RND family efflux transporter MFP subunit
MKRDAILVGLVVALTLASAAGCGHESKSNSVSKTEKVYDVTTVRVSTLPGSGTDALSGTIAPRNRAEIAARIQARVESIPVKLGSSVQTGDVLATLDMQDLKARVSQAKALADQASQELARYTKLWERKLVSQQEYDRVRAASDVASAGLEDAQAALGYARIVAPFSGTVTQKGIDIGDMTTPGRILFSIDESAELRLVVAIPESHRAGIMLGDSVQVEVPSVNTTVKGAVAEISNGADAVTRSFEAKISLPRLEALRSGQYGLLHLQSDSAAGMFVPKSALVNRGQLEIVYVVDDSSRAVMRLVRTGRQIGTHVEIVSGLMPDEEVVVDCPPALAEGDRIKAGL